MAKRSRSRKRAERRAAQVARGAGQAGSGAEDVLTALGLRLTGLMPGALMYRAAPPAGVPDLDTPRSRRVFALRKSPVLPKGPELDAVTGSVAKTLARAEYHYQRLLSVYEELRRRREALPGEVFFDTLVACMHYELQAFCGGARMLFDEVVYLLARRHGIAENRAKRWDTNKLVTEAVAAGSEHDVAEIKILRSHLGLYENLNAYRNSVFHHGWRHGAGHFDSGDGQIAASSESMNGLLLPDRASLRGRSKPHEWTWKDRTLIDDLARRIHTELGAMVDELCDEWQTPVPALGTIPLGDQANLFVRLFKPIMVLAPHALFVPVFSNQELASACRFFAPPPHAELVRVRSSTAVIGVRALSFSAAGLEKNVIPAGVRNIVVVLDPVPEDAVWSKLGAAQRATTDISELLERGTINPVNVPFPIDTVYGWHEPTVHPWV